MDLTLDKLDLVNLVMGTTPSYKTMELPIIKSVGYYTGGHHDKWTWQRTPLEALSEDSLYEIYTLCKYWLA